MMGRITFFVELFKKTISSHLFWVMFICLVVQVVYYAQVLPYEVCGDTSSYTYQYDASFRTPIYPLFGSLIRTFTGDEEAIWLTSMATIQRIMMFISIIFFWKIVCYLTTNKKVCFLMTIIYGATPAIFSWANCILTEAFSIIEIVILTFFATRYLLMHKRIDAFMQGIMVLLLILTRPASVYLLAVYALFWGVQLFVAFRRKGLKKRITSIRFGILGFTVAVCGVLGYCFAQKVFYDRFSLSSVAYVNDLLIVIDTDLYKLSSNDEIRTFISQEKQETSDNYRIIWHGLMKKYSREELESFARNTMHENRIEYIRKIVVKMIRWGTQLASDDYNTFKEDHSLTPGVLAGALFPISFGMIYIVIVGGCVSIMVRIIRKKRIDWVMLAIISTIGGNVAVTIIAAPYEPGRLCVASLPLLIILVTYTFGICSKNGGGKRLESSLR